MKHKTSLYCAALLSLTGNAVGQNVPQLGKAPTDTVIAAMTLDEKISLLIGAGEANTTTGTPPSAVVGSTNKIVPGAAGTTHSIPRLGIPSIVVADGPAGLRIHATRNGTDSTFYCTHFPIATLLACTWNTDLVHQVGYAIGNETREYGVDILLAPATNLMRNPLCGRNFEYYSEDPLLSGKTAAAMTHGIQQNGVGTSLKHFALNNQETNRTRNNALVSRRAMHDLYLKPFEIAVREAAPWTVMTSYNRINGVYASENTWLLDTILRDKWGFQGAVMTDWFGGTHVARQMQAGNDLLMPGTREQEAALKEAVRSGKISLETVNRNVRHLLDLIPRTPRFRKTPYSNSPDLKAHASISRQAATEGMVLLKNNSLTLPLTNHPQKIAAFGITSYNFIAGGSGSGDVNRAYTISLTDGLQNAGMQPDSSLTSLYRNYIARETPLLPVPEWGHPAQCIAEMELTDSLIHSQASKQDVAIITLGRTSGEFADRSLKNDFYLSDAEQTLLDKVCTAFHNKGKKVIVILNICGVIETASWKDKPDAILVAWLAGQEGGHAVADILSGTVTPSGKPTMTFPISYEDVPSAPNFPLPGNTANRDSTRYEEDIYVGYRHYDTFGKPVSYPFGYGLSYTRFSYENLQVSLEADTIRISCLITNTGKADGKEIAQLYISSLDNKTEHPLKELKAFAKTKTLRSGESDTVSFLLPKTEFTVFDSVTGNQSEPRGAFRIYVNASCTDYRLETSLTPYP